MRMLESNTPLHAQGIQNRTERTQAWVSILRERSVKIFAIYIRFFCKLRHSFLCFSDVSKSEEQSLLGLLRCGI